MNTEEPEVRVHTRATYGDWNLDHDGAIIREGKHIAHYDEETKELVYDSRDLARQWRLPVTNLLRQAGIEPLVKRSRESAPVPEDAPPRPDISRSPWGIFDPRIVRWTHKYAFDEFVVTYDVHDTSEGARKHLPVHRKEVDYYYRNRVPGHRWREFGEEVIDHAMKYPAAHETVMTFVIATPLSESEQNTDFNVKY